MQLAFTERLDTADNLNHKLHCMPVNHVNASTWTFSTQTLLGYYSVKLNHLDVS